MLVAELVSAGRGAAAQPAFEPGPRIPLAKGARDGAEVGDLVTVTMRGRAGRVTAVHGSARSPRAALRALLAANALGIPFPRAVLEEAEAQDEDAPARDRGRRDLRDQRVITIDPEGAKDHDDAIAVTPEGADATRLWVHIADVSRFVPAGGALDREAARRGTSVYVPGMVDPMLPPRLSSDLCSLRPGVDRAAVTVEMVITAGGEVTDTRFSRSLIRSERRLTYPEVDALTAGETLGDPGLEADLARAALVAGGLRERRLARGALEASSPEPVVTFAGDRVAGIHLEGQTPAHSLVEECMIAANEAVARYLIGRGRPTVFRHHEDPAQSRIELLYEQLAELDVATPPLPEGPLGPAARRAAAVAAADAVARHLASGRGGPALWTLVLRSLRQAYYSPLEPGHSGLPARPTCTSPRPSGATPTCWCTAACSTPWAWATRPPGRPSSPRPPTTARPPSARPRPSSAGGTTSARPSCSTTSCPAAAGRAAWRGPSWASSTPACSSRWRTSSPASSRRGAWRTTTSAPIPWASA